MHRYFNPAQPFQGLLGEEFISFNIRRSSDSYSPFSRKVMLLPASRSKKTIVPGIKEKSERGLLREIKGYQNWRELKRHSFEISPHLFSFLWRFSEGHKFVSREVEAKSPLGKKEAKKAVLAYKKYKASLQADLSPGRVYIIPDAAILFQDPNRYKRPYARRVLIMSVQRGQLVMIPFTTRLKRINENTDILFDPTHKGPRLDRWGIPAVENFPYKIFSRKAVLCVCAAQPMSEEDFLDSILVSIGSLNNDLLNFVLEKMKNL